MIIVIKGKLSLLKDYSENLLRKIISVTNISFTFDFFFAQFVDVLNPVMAIDILVEKLDSEMSGPNMWHFVYVKFSFPILIRF